MAAMTAGIFTAGESGWLVWAIITQQHTTRGLDWGGVGWDDVKWYEMAEWGVVCSVLMWL